MPWRPVRWKGTLGLVPHGAVRKIRPALENRGYRVLQSPSGAAPPKGARAETIRKLFEKSSRTSAFWILAWLRLADDPRDLEQWNKLIESESAFSDIRLPRPTMKFLTD